MSIPPRVGTADRGKVIRKVLVTAAIGGVTYVVTTLTQQSQISSVTLATFLGGVALVVQFLAEFEGRMASVETTQAHQLTETRRLVEQKFAAVSEATELFGAANAAPLGDDVIELVRRANRLDHSTEPLVLALARSQIKRVTGLLADIDRGTDVVYEGEDRDWLLALTRGARHSISAVSRGSDRAGEFFDEGMVNTELGRRYLRLQKDARRRNVAIRRVFVLERLELADSETFRKEVYEAQRDCDIDVRVYDMRAASRKVDLAFLTDFVLFDDTVLYELVPPIVRSAEPMWMETKLILDPDRVRLQSDWFTTLWESSVELS